MSGKRLLDAIQFLNAAGSVATKHLAVRQRQLDVFTRTSSLTKGVKNQADGVILTAQAAAALARRFNEPSPPHSTSKTNDSPAAQPPSSSRTATQDTIGTDAIPRTTERPHGSGLRPNSLAPDEARKLQRQAEFQIPSSVAEHTSDESTNGLSVSQQQETFYKPSQETTPGLSSLPRVKLPHSSSDSQGGVRQDINADVFHSPLKAGEASPEGPYMADKDEIPDELAKDLFHSPRVARMLTNSKASSDVKNNGWRTSPYARRPNGHNATSPPREGVKQSQKKYMENLGASIAENVAAMPEVRKAESRMTDDTLTYLYRRNQKPQKILRRPKPTR